MEILRDDQHKVDIMVNLCMEILKDNQHKVDKMVNLKS